MSIKLMTLVWDMELPTTQKIVLLALADNANDEGICWPSITTLEKKTSLHRATVIRTISELEERSHLSRSSESGKTNTYQLNPSHSATSSTERLVAQDDYTRRTQRLVPVAQRDYTRRTARPRTIIEPSIEPSLNTQNVREVVDIVALKLAYPRGTYAGVAWMDAERACNQLLEEGETPETILESVNQYADQQVAMGRIGTQFITSPAKFFRSGLWRGPFPFPEKPQTVKPKSTWLEQEDDDAQS
jgi:hypothetical protein